jgi:hypothetical protein
MLNINYTEHKHKLSDGNEKCQLLFINLLLSNCSTPNIYWWIQFTDRHKLSRRQSVGKHCFIPHDFLSGVHQFLTNQFPVGLFAVFKSVHARKKMRWLTHQNIHFSWVQGCTRTWNQFSSLQISVAVRLLVKPYIVICLISLKRKARLMRSPFCQSVCPPPKSFDPDDRFLRNSDGRICNLKITSAPCIKSSSFNHFRTTDVQTSEVDVKHAPCHFVCWQTSKGWTAFNQTIFVREKSKYDRGGRLKAKIQIFVCEGNSWTVVLIQLSLAHWKVTNIPTGFISIIILVDEVVNVAMMRNFEVMLGQTLNHSVEFCNFVQCHVFINHLTCYIMWRKLAD